MDDMDMEELGIIAAEQSREFMAASAIDSDLDLAFRLQLQEAMSASLALHPSSSTSSSSSSASQSQSQSQSLSLSLSNDVNLTELQTLALDTFMTEIKDRRLTDSETTKSHCRRIHDQKVAPHVEFTKFQRPYGEEASSSKREEVFRVYFKGLLSEELVRGVGSSRKTVTLAGIGVAICDSRDELIFEMSKPLELLKDDRTSRQSVEGKALIEAFNAATALDLNRIVFCCDYHPLYQYLSGRWQPKQKKIKMFVDQVNLLRENFTHCEPSLLARKDVKFAFKLAREAIVSQISKEVESHDKVENCVICLDDKFVDQFFSVAGCEHRYCTSCMKQHVEVKLLHGMLPKCPHEGCESELNFESCKSFLTPRLTEMMRQQLKEASIPVTEKVYCPYPKCSALMSKAELLRLPRLIYENGARTCYKCHGNFCINCRVPWHRNMNCAEYKRKNPNPLVEESKLKNLAARNLWRQCIKCKHMIELAAGCYHMTCRCGYEFCYTCGAEWKNKKATCTCPLWDEENIVNTDEEDDDDDVFDDEEEDDDDFGDEFEYDNGYLF